MRQTIRMGRRFSLVLGTVLALGGCTSEGTTAPPSAELAPAVLEAMTDGLQDEYRAAAVYEGVLTQFGQVLPFRNILQAEQKHAASIAALFAVRGLAVPTRTSEGSIPSFASVTDACALGATAEVENIALYDRLLALELPLDVRRVFDANRLASLNNHLPAFERCGPIAVGVR